MFELYSTLESSKAAETLTSNLHLLLVALFGGFVLCGVKIAEHFNKPKYNKFPKSLYILWLLGIVVFFPVLGVGMVAIYLIDGAIIGAVLAFQVGLTSPALAQGMMGAIANQQGRKPLDLPDEA